MPIDDDAKEQLDGLISLVYKELRRLAEQVLKDERTGHTLSATSLVHEAYLRLGQAPAFGWESPAHFKAIAANVMRRVLIDHGRGKNRQKRGGGWARVTLAYTPVESGEPTEVDVLDLHEALLELSQLDERQAKIVELRCFGDLTLEEIGKVIGLSERTVRGDWAMARAWLRRRLGEERGP